MCRLIKTFINVIIVFSLIIPPKNDTFVSCNMAAKVLHISVQTPAKSVRGGVLSSLVSITYDSNPCFSMPGKARFRVSAPIHGNA